MKALLGICVILAILTASLEGAAEVPSSADLAPMCAEDVAEKTGDGKDDCVVCTPFCHCSLHGAALVGEVSRPGTPVSTSFAVLTQARHASLTEPPSLPPPIL